MLPIKEALQNTPLLSTEVLAVWKSCVVNVEMLEKKKNAYMRSLPSSHFRKEITAQYEFKYNLKV